MKYKKYIGIDVSKRKLNIKYDSDSSIVTIANKKKLFNKLKSYFGKDKKRVIVFLEATSGEEKAVAKWLLSNDVGVFIIKTKHLTDFAKLSGYFVKNKAIDADIIRQYGLAYMKNLYFKEERDELEFQLDLLNYKKKSLHSTLIKLKSSLLAAQNKKKVRLTKKAITFFDKKRAGVKKEISDALQRDEELLFKIHSSMGTKIIAPVETHTIIGELPDLVKFSNESKAALISIFPYRRDRRKKTGQNGY